MKNIQFMETITKEKSSQKLSEETRGGGRVSMLSLKRRTELANFLCDSLKKISEPKAKHVRLQNAIRRAILAGVLQPNDQLPPEQEIADGVGLSLGTVRRCLSELARKGVVSREHGRGTFISGITMTENEVWHTRFLENDLKTVRPIYQRVINREVINKLGSWSDVLGHCKYGFIRIERAVSVDSLFICYSDLYVLADRFKEVMEMTTHEIESIGLKHIMALNFNVPIVNVQKILQTAPTPQSVSSVIQVEAGKPAHRLQVIGYDIDNQPVSYQVIWIPENNIPLDLSPMTHPL